MDRRRFLKAGFIGSGTILGLPTALLRGASGAAADGDPGDCELAPRDTSGPFPIRTPAELVRANIVSDRTGIALLMTLTVVDQSEGCRPIAGALVDVWHCDSRGNYSEYGSHSEAHFLRGRQTTGANGQVSFITIYPGWYPGRAPHIHVEVLDAEENSIRISQIAFPEEASEAVYAGEDYDGGGHTPNTGDFILRGQVEAFLADSVTGNVRDGFTLTKTLVV